MPLFLLAVGLLLLASGVRGETKNLFALIQGDFTGPGNFIYWVVSILFVGAIGYIKPLKPVSDAFLVLVILVLFLRKGTGFFDQITNAIHSTDTFVDTKDPSYLAPFSGVFKGNGASANW